MRFLRLLPFFMLMFVLAMTVAAQAPEGRGGAPGAGGPPRPPFTMMVSGFADGGDFPIKNSAAGDMTSPGISWINAPPGTVTFLLHMHDMDNARNKTTEDQLH